MFSGTIHMHMQLAETLMEEFVKKTGVIGDKSPQRYLWTDAFAGCNLIELARLTSKQKYWDWAVQLVDQVHHILGQYRRDDPREGWLASPAHPTAKGLRIGKPLPERSVGEPVQPRKEWDRDGQYFHYLTKWMLALVKIGTVMNNSQYLNWAGDLVNAATRFVHGQRMYWKMSTDLSRPLVASMGQHDPIDGYATFQVVDHASAKDLHQAISMMRQLLPDVQLATHDPLGLGGLMINATHLQTLGVDNRLVEKIRYTVKTILSSLDLSKHSLAFRELGLAIGLAGAENLTNSADLQLIRKKLVEYWDSHRNWDAHWAINQVMLATAHIPTAVLDILHPNR